ncbi:YtpR family tRNA-binding protein [Alkalibacterium thalassium]|jgi:tRNA-binding protein|uniref:tRNA-binding protein n=1 Tax=Alkalibacterium thalassium TaxID=426701 RepID=A0A1G8WA07_9LACT|nr:DUF4479 and tRNA-binding domain-containing protein [Alkalibacterium thalassium]SDJ75108.1 tRNA-binding protein [Alkalibacterium thalassium]
MQITTYNNNGLNDVLMIQFKKMEATKQVTERNGDIVLIKSKADGEATGINLFKASDYLEGLTEGPLELDKKAVDKLNSLIEEAGFSVKLETDYSPKFVIGYVTSCEPVEGSDHLNLTQTEVDNGEILQIVCGAANIAQGQKVVVARTGAVMPDGMIIWPGELKGVESNGMICSARELGLPQEGKGIMVLPDDAEVGKAFSV